MDDFVFYVVVACASNDNITYQHAKYPSLFYASQFNQLNSHFLFCIKKKKALHLSSYRVFLSRMSVVITR